MKLKDQVCGLELAKRIKELEVLQESLFIWIDEFPVFNDKVRLASVGEFKDRLAVSLLSEDARSLVQTYSAYTVAELGELLPKKHQQIKHYQRHQSEWVCRFDYGISPTGAHMETADTEADARAKMLIYLLENDLLR